ncbi:M20 family metallopeptidase [Pontibacillus yanchengensis]|uniref:Uncharacterized protein n=1 Tax=Pontibacillus yanchengensis Y32 TaxID=1385514 RepID=A0A0A2T9Y5_9BACI|nr:M20 family metallopeptidase [Pontibacillus yanchengensis]KGP72647.1 hypothetical protein N782_11335 [Pontibacillus yanchengensis Y32]
MNVLNEENLFAQLKQEEPNLLDSLKKLVRIPSVLTEDKTPYPFGAPIQEALETTVRLCEELGFRVYIDPDGYYGYAEIGEGNEMVGVLGHLDVVPPGSLENWETHPFEPVMKTGKMYGRGTQDDKGPTLAALFAAKALMNMGVTFPKRLRFIFGTDEETLWRCMNKYTQQEEMPSYGFVPDSSFPLTYAEKGLLQLQLEADNETALSIEGGSAFNAVPDSIVYQGEDQELLVDALQELSFPFEEAENGVKILGKSAHAQVTEQGINAISLLAIALHHIGKSTKSIDFIANEIGEDPYATSIFGNCEDEVSGKLKCNIGMIDIGQRETISIDIRIPVTVDKEEVVQSLINVADNYSLHYKEVDWLKSIYIPKDHFIVKNLMEVYQEETGDTVSEPISAGGATYARAIENAVAFGAVFPNRPKVEHRPNEYIDLTDLFSAMKIYAKAIYQLTR